MPPELANFFSAQVMLFLVFALGALSTGVTMVLFPNPVRSALFLVLNLFCVAVLYLLLNAYFLAAVQVIVYAGAIMVLFLFVIMLLNLGSPDRAQDRLRWQQPVAVAAGILLAATLGGVIASSVPAVPGIPPDRTPVDGQDFRVGIGQQAPHARMMSMSGAGGGGATGDDRTRQATPGAVTEARSARSADLVPRIPYEERERYRRDALGTVGGNTITRIGINPQTGQRQQYQYHFDGIGQVLYDPEQPWLFAFEITSVLLLIAVIGSVVLALRRRNPHPVEVTGTGTAGTDGSAAEEVRA